MNRVAALLLCCAGLAAAQQPAAPYKEARKIPQTFEGPGRDAPEPADITEVLLGYFGPSDPAHPDGGTLWQGATLAIEEANHEGGYRGKPFRLVARWSEDPWRSGAAHVTRMTYQDRVWVVIGSIEGAGTHLAEQVAAKALVTIVSPVATDRTTHSAGVPWIFSLAQGDDQHAAVLARALHGRSIVIVSSTDHDSRAFNKYFRAACASQSVNLKLQIELAPGQPDLSSLARDAAAQESDTIVVVASARESARAVQALRGSGYAGAIAGSPKLGRTAFTANAGAAAEGAVFPWIGEPASAFRRTFTARFGTQPDDAAAGAYDAVRLVVSAIREAGLNRARIRDAIAARPAFTGAGGRIEWDATGQNRRPPVLAVIHEGYAMPGSRL